MTQGLQAAYRARTGIAAIDAVRYLVEPRIEPHQHRETDILFYRLANDGPPGAYTRAERDTGEPDLLLLSRGGGVPAHGRLAGTPFTVAANTGMRTTFIPQGADCSLTFGVAAHSINLMFPAGFLAGLVAEQRHGSFAPMLFQDESRLAGLMRLLEAEIIAPGFASQLLVDGLSRAIATLLVRLDTGPVHAEAERIHLPPWKLRRVLDFVESHLDREIGLDDLARIADLSPFHFSRVFKLAMGSAPYHYVRDRRLARSRTLLAEGRLCIAELALACGFANQSHFTAAFTKAMGVSPARFRRQIIG